MKRRLIALTLAVCAWAAVPAALHAAAAPALEYTPEMRGPAPIPPAEQGLQTITATPWFKVSDEGLQLEGPVFDRAGNLIFTEVFGGRVFRLTPGKTLETILGENTLAPAGLAIHKDGRIFIAGLGDFKDAGSVVAMSPDGSGLTAVVPDTAGFLPDDLVFDDRGGFYFTDFKGTSTDPTGGVYYVGPEGGEPVAVLPNLSVANGIGLSPDGKTLWVTEFSKGVLHRVSLSDATTIAPFGTTVPYHFTGPAPDSLRTDADGNVYVAMYGQGRVLVFNPNGMPIAQILLPGRETAHNLRSTSMVIRPGTNDMYILTNDWTAGEGSTIFHCKALAAAPVDFSHR
ncbi:SMP-30/gluconolactonase/LRE family protein [Tistrella mobilis]|uniref:SMP-30/gluconolactonase/LRE family protein n=1 Tax=Tistrella mobilis TaxID=171437 RepID=UPI0035591F18